MLDVGSGMRQQDLGAGERVFYPWPGCQLAGPGGRQPPTSILFCLICGHRFSVICR